MKVRMIVAAAVLAGVQALSASAAEPWKFAPMLPLTGSLAGYAHDLKLGMEIAADEINRKGGINGRPVALSLLDTQSNPAQVATLVRQACNDALVVIPALSTEARVAFPVANSLQCPAIASVAAAVGLTASNRPWTFTAITPADVMTPLAAEIMVAKAKAKPKKAVVIIERGDPSALDQGELTAKTLARQGVQVENLTVSSTDVDFGPVVTRAVGANPDLIVVATMDRASLGLLKELRKSRKASDIMLTQSGYNSLVGSLPTDVLDGLYRYSLSDPITSQNPRVKEFIKTYESRSNGRAPTLTSTLAYDAIMMARDAVEKGGLKGDPATRAEDRKKFIDALSKLTDWPGMTGKMSMSPQGYMVKAPTLLVHRSGKWEQLTD